MHLRALSTITILLVTTVALAEAQARVTAAAEDVPSISDALVPDPTTETCHGATTIFVPSGPDVREASVSVRHVGCVGVVESVTYVLDNGTVVHSRQPPSPDNHPNAPAGGSGNVKTPCDPVGRAGQVIGVLTFNTAGGSTTYTDETMNFEWNSCDSSMSGNWVTTQCSWYGSFQCDRAYGSAWGQHDGSPINSWGYADFHSFIPPADAHTDFVSTAAWHAGQSWYAGVYCSQSGDLPWDYWTDCSAYTSNP
ncbi:MAG: hypothetical protein QOE90_827 [Thermoplasmata archaeon]|jgi:hypothetical protein|nr:hypothetical protein [Thermoplasmata archaeon]